MRLSAQRAWRKCRNVRGRWAAPAASVLGAAAVVAVVALFATTQPTAQATPQLFTGSSPSPEVRTVVQLGQPDLHPRQLAYDRSRDGIWFWTSSQQIDPQGRLSFDDRVYFYDIKQSRLRSWPIYSGDWSSQMLAGLAVAPTGDVWIGWNHNLVDFHPADGSSTRYVLPAHTAYPLPAAVTGDLPTDLGIADLAIARDGTIWIARYAALALTTFSPSSRSFTEHPLPANAGDPARLALGPDGHVFFTIDLAADHPGYGAQTVGEYDPQVHVTHIYAQGATALAVTPQGDLYTTLSGRGLARLTAAERASAAAQGRAPVFQQQMVPFDVDAVSLASDARGRIWMAVGGKPEMAVLDPATGRVQQYQYAAPGVAAHPLPSLPLGARPVTPAPQAVWLVHIAAMATDGQGHLWYVRAGWGDLEEVAA